METCACQRSPCTLPDGVAQAWHVLGCSACGSTIRCPVFLRLASHAQVGEPPLRKEVGAELGCVTPYIVAPGAWSSDDIGYYADEIVAGLVHNAGHNCTKAEILVTDAAWPQREALVAAVRCVCQRFPNAPCSIECLAPPIPHAGSMSYPSRAWSGSARASS